MRAFLLLALLSFSFQVLATIAPTLMQYQLDKTHADLSFAVKHMMVSNTKGTFNNWDASFMFDEKSGTLADVKVSIDTSSINTKDEKRDDHLKNEDFFNTNKFPKMEFVSKKVINKKNKPSKIIGDLTLLGVTKEVTLNVDFLGATKSFTGAQIVAFKGGTVINRKDFGMTWNKNLDKGGLAIGEKVEINFDFEANPTNK